MNSVAVEVEVDLPKGVRIRGYERHQGAHVFEVEFDLPSDCRCLKCGHEAEANIRYKKPDARDSRFRPAWATEFLGLSATDASMSALPATDSSTDPFQASARDVHLALEQSVLEQLVGGSVEEVAAAGRFGRDDRRHRGIPIGRRTRDSARTRDHQRGLRRAEPGRSGTNCM